MGKLKSNVEANNKTKISIIIVFNLKPFFLPLYVPNKFKKINKS